VDVGVPASLVQAPRPRPGNHQVRKGEAIKDCRIAAIEAGMYAAYDALSNGLKKIPEGLRASHSSRHQWVTTGLRHLVGIKHG
jgi:hypothetical protein